MDGIHEVLTEWGTAGGRWGVGRRVCVCVRGRSGESRRSKES